MTARDHILTRFEKERQERVECAMKRFEISLRKPQRRRKRWKRNGGLTDAKTLEAMEV